MSVNLSAKYQAIARGYTVIFRNTVRSQAPFWPSVAMRVPSTSNEEAYQWLGSVPMMKEYLGERIFEGLRASDYQIKNKTWEQSLGLERHVIDDDRYGLYNPVVSDMARKAVRHPDKLVVELLRDGESTVCYDGQYFYDTDHAEGTSGSQSNDLTYNAVDTANVTVDEFRKAFTAALIQMLQFKDDRGDPFVEAELATPGNLVCLVPPALWDVANKAMNQSLTSDGNAGVTNVMVARAAVVPLNRYSAALGGSDIKFDLLYTGGAIRPVIFQDRSPLRFESEGADSILTKDIKLASEARYNVGYGLWQHAVRTTFT